MRVSEKYKNLFVIVITMIAANLIFQNRTFRELMVDLAIFILAYLFLFPFLESLAVFMTDSKKDHFYD